jgi:hypothetical protein
MRAPLNPNGIPSFSPVPRLRDDEGATLGKCDAVSLNPERVEALWKIACDRQRICCNPFRVEPLLVP